jgi:peptidoglycan/xylan/chitin deacetylase (PgdA/CDA1 family)
MRAILTYHSLDDSGSVISVSPAVFERHMAWLASSQTRVVTLDELMALPDDVDALALTFDDGFVSFTDVAWPRLRDRGWRATLLVVTGFVGGSNDWSAPRRFRVPRLPLLDWDTLGRLAEEGVELGAHTRTHPDLTRVSVNALVDELHGCREDLRQYAGVTPRVFAYPFGLITAMAAATAAVSFRWGLTTEFRLVETTDQPNRLPRLDAFYFSRSGHLEAFGTPGFRRRVRMRGAVRALRTRLGL